MQMKFAVAAFAMISTLFAEHMPAAEMKKILVFGDSLSDGFMLKRSEAYPALLAKKLRAAGLNFEVINASASVTDACSFSCGRAVSPLG